MSTRVFATLDGTMFRVTFSVEPLVFTFPDGSIHRCEHGTKDNQYECADVNERAAAILLRSSSDG